MLFLLKDNEGRALIMAQTPSQAEADRFGRNHLPEFCGESIEIDLASREEAEEFWGVRTVRLMSVRLDPQKSVGRRSLTHNRPVSALTLTNIWVRGLELPEDVQSDGFLTPEDHRDLALDHIARTSEMVAQVEIFKRA